MQRQCQCPYDRVGARGTGVEVARAYQQVNEIGKAQAVSSEEVGAFLRSFGSKFAAGTEGRRHRAYTLYLEGPGFLERVSRPDARLNFLTQHL